MNLKILGIIPARGGSKGVLNKNIKPLLGKSLIQRAFETGVQSGCLHRIIISTDDPEIASHAQSIGIEVPFMRPAEFATDTSPMIEVVKHVLTEIYAMGEVIEAVMLLQPTSPLRTIAHIKMAVELLNGYDSVCSVSPLPLTHCPHYVMKVDEFGRMDYFLPEGKTMTRRQDVPQAYTRDGTIYFARKEVIFETNSFYGNNCQALILDPSEVLSIDTQEDWTKAEELLRLRESWFNS